jgi:hypothetical protein
MHYVLAGYSVNSETVDLRLCTKMQSEKEKILFIAHVLCADILFDVLCALFFLEGDSMDSDASRRSGVRSWYTVAVGLLAEWYCLNPSYSPRQFI